LWPQTWFFPDEFQTLLRGTRSRYSLTIEKVTVGMVRPQQPRRSLSHHVRLVIVPGIGKHLDLLDEWLGPSGIAVQNPIATLPLGSDGELIASPISVTVS
jgi:hypothetical protein